MWPALLCKTITVLTCSQKYFTEKQEKFRFIYTPLTSGRRWLILRVTFDRVVMAMAMLVGNYHASPRDVGDGGPDGEGSGYRYCRRQRAVSRPSRIKAVEFDWICLKVDAKSTTTDDSCERDIQYVPDSRVGCGHVPR